MLSNFTPCNFHPLNENHYDRLEKIFEELLDKGDDSRSPEEDALFNLLADLLEDYETRTLPPVPDLSPREMLASLMKTNNLKQADLTDVFGSQSVVSDILKGKRQINLAQAKRLAERFKMKLEAFI